MRKIKIILVLVSLSAVSQAQMIHDNPVLSSKKIDINTTCAWFSNNGSFRLEWPKGSGIFVRYASGIWLFARKGNDTAVAIADYDYEYVSGYTDGNGIPQGKNDPLYRIYRLTYGINDSDRQMWPSVILGNSNQGAPIYFDTLSSSWKPLDFGGQTMYYIYTDSDPTVHNVTGGSTAPLKADIKQINFAFASEGALGNVIYSVVTLINRSTEVWNDAFITIWSDDDLGYAVDDKVGCDSSMSLGYTYNAGNTDPIYGTAPPAVGFVYIKGLDIYTGNSSDTVFICYGKTKKIKVGYRNSGLNVFNFNHGGDPFFGDPLNFRQSCRYMSGFRRDGSPIIHPSGYATKFIYTGDPVTNTGWVQSEIGDQRILLSSGPVNINPGDTHTIVFAQVIARGNSNLNSITALRQFAQEARNYYLNCFINVPMGIENNTEVVNSFKLFQNYPNPFNPATKIRFDIPSNAKRETSNVKLTIFDVLGREVAVLVNERLKAGSYTVDFDGSEYPSGIYFYSLEVTKDSKLLYSGSRKMVIIR